MTLPQASRPAVWMRREDCSVDEFATSVETDRTVLDDYPHAASVEQEVLLYGPDLAERVAEPGVRADVQAEVVRALLDGPGIAVFQGALAAGVVDRATDAFHEMLSAQRAAGVTSGDHFAKPGANDRVWGALDKLALTRPEVFVDYYANDVLALASSAWLGPGYQVTSALNIVNPGGQAQVP